MSSKLAPAGEPLRAAAVIPRGVQRKGAPARADFENTIFRSQTQLAADPVELLHLGLFQGIAGVAVDRAGVDHIPVEKEAEEIVAQVVVRLNIAAAARHRIAVHAMAQPMEEAACQGRQGVAAFQFGKIARGQAHHRHRIRRGPISVNVGISGGIVASPQHAGKEALVVNHEGSLQAGAVFAEPVGAFRADYFQRSVAHVFQYAEYRFAGKTRGHDCLVTS